MHLQTAAAAGNLTALHELDAAPELPWRWRYLFGWWRELAEGRQGSGMGASGLAWSDMHAWAACTGRNPSPAEWRLIRQIDNLFVAAHSEPAPAA